MADSTLTALPAASSVAGADLIYVVQGGVSKKATLTLVSAAAAPLWNNLAAPTGNFTLANAGFTTALSFDAITTQDAFTLSSSSLSSGDLAMVVVTGTAAASNTQTALNIQTSGANAGSTQTTFGEQISNTHTGTASTNVALKLTASGGTSNYALTATGLVGFGTSTPVAALDVLGQDVSAAATDSVSIFNAAATALTKNDANTRVFYGALIKPTFNLGGANTSTTYRTVFIDSTNTAVTGLTTDPFTVAYGGTNKFRIGGITSTNTSGGISLGHGATATGNASISIGVNSAASGGNSMCLSSDTATCSASWSHFFGRYGTMAASYSVGIGSTVQALSGADGAIVIGQGVSQPNSQYLTAYKTYTFQLGMSTVFPSIFVDIGGGSGAPTTVGNVGINNDSPQAMLDVTGNVIVRGTNGTELVVNGDFATSATWVYGAGWTYDSGNFEADHAANGTGTLSQTISIVSGRKYRVTYRVKNRTVGSVTVSLGGTAGTARSANGYWQETITTVSTADLSFAVTATGDRLSVDDVSVQELNGGTLEVWAAGIASTPAQKLPGIWFTGGSATTTKPQLLIEPSGTTSTGWSTSGTGLGINAASGFAGNLIAAQLNGVSQFGVLSSGRTNIGPGTQFTSILQVNNAGATSSFLSYGAFSGFAFESVRTTASGSSGGSNIVLQIDDGAATGSGDRLGGVFFGGADDAAATRINGAGITAFASALWTGSSAPTDIAFEVVPSGSLTRAEVLRIDSTGSVILKTVGKTISLKTGTGAMAGNATLVAGTVTVTNANVTGASSIIMLTRKTSGGTIGDLSYTITDNTSFTINSVNVLDTSTVSYIIVQTN